MKVWIGYVYSFDGVGQDRAVERVFDDEAKAKLWIEDPTYIATTNLDFDWRDYDEYEVE